MAGSGAKLKDPALSFPARTCRLPRDPHQGTDGVSDRESYIDDCFETVEITMLHSGKHSRWIAALQTGAVVL